MNVQRQFFGFILSFSWQRVAALRTSFHFYTKVSLDESECLTHRGREKVDLAFGIEEEKCKQVCAVCVPGPDLGVRKRRQNLRPFSAGKSHSRVSWRLKKGAGVSWSSGDSGGLGWLWAHGVFGDWVLSMTRLDLRGGWLASSLSELRIQHLMSYITGESGCLQGVLNPFFPSP